MNLLPGPANDKFPVVLVTYTFAWRLLKGLLTFIVSQSILGIAVSNLSEM